MNCIIVDDEIIAQDLLEHYVLKTPVLHLIGKFGNALELFKFLHSNNPVDLIFLDIKMPEISGLELVSALKSTPKIIFTTAYHEHAVDAFNLNAVDYLLKPFSYERFLQAVSKAMPENKLNVKQQAVDNKIFIKSDKKLKGIDVNEILFVESLRNYFVITTTKGEKITIHNTLTYLEEALHEYESIIRVHRSFFVNSSMIKEITGNVVVLEHNYQVPIGQLYREQVLVKLKIL